MLESMTNKGILAIHYPGLKNDYGTKTFFLVLVPLWSYILKSS